MTILDSLFRSVLDVSIWTSAAIGGVLVLRLLFRGQVAARWLFLAWVALAIRLLWPASFQVSWSPFRVWDAAAPEAQLTAYSSTSDSGPGSLVSTGAGQRQAGEPRKRDMLRDALPRTPARWAAVVWAAGAGILLLARVGAHLVLAHRLRRSAPTAVDAAALLPRGAAAALVTKGVTMLVSPVVSTPALHGMIRPRLLVPPGFLERLTAREIEHVVAHEVAHAQRRDLLAEVVIHLATVVHWFNPLVWLLAHAGRQDCEVACDELVVAGREPQDRDDYGATLLKIVTLAPDRPHAGVGLGIVESKQQLKRRIQMIVTRQPVSFARTCIGAALFSAILGLSLTRGVSAQAPLAPPAPAFAAESSDNRPAATPIAYDPSIDRLDALFPKGVVATVGERSITVAEVRSYIAPLIASMKANAKTQEEFNGRLLVLQNSAIKDLVNRAVLLRQFRDQRPGEQAKHIDDAYIDTSLSDLLQERFGGDRAKLLAYLRERNLTLADYRKEIEEDIIYNYMRNQERKITGGGVKRSPDNSDKPVRLRVIQLSRSGTDTDATLLAKAQVIADRFRQGESFAALAEEFDESKRRSRGGDWGWQGPADLRREYRDAFLALQKGEMSAPIVVSEGCFLLYAEDRR